MELLCTEGKELGCKSVEECKECWNRPSREMLMMNINPMSLALVAMGLALNHLKKSSTLVGQQVTGDMESSIMSLTSEVNRLKVMVHKLDNAGI